MPPSPDLIVSGTQSPDVTGNYLYDGDYASQPSYKHETLALYIWWDNDPNWWMITNAKGGAGGWSFKKSDHPVTGTYAALPIATGTAIVTAP